LVTCKKKRVVQNVTHSDTPCITLYMTFTVHFKFTSLYILLLKLIVKVQFVGLIYSDTLYKFSNIILNAEALRHEAV
jgi:hypothetical protein